MAAVLSHLPQRGWQDGCSPSFVSGSTRSARRLQSRPAQSRASRKSAPRAQGVEQPRHFARTSLYQGGLTDPSDIIQHCLTMFRRGDVAVLRPYLPASYWPHCLPAEEGASSSSSSGGSSSSSSSSSSPMPLMVGGQIVEERGPLAPLAGLLDVGARRVLPGHLLRRSRVLSTLRLGDAFQQRTALTACTGEEAVLEWRLRQREPGEDEEPVAGSSSSSSGGSSSHGISSSSKVAAWVIEAVERDARSDEPLPITPHPRCSPEAVIRAQLLALQRFDVFEAAAYNMWRPGVTGASGFGLTVHCDMLQRQLSQPPYRLLMGHSQASLGPAALPSQREMLQEVVVFGAQGMGAAVFRWRLGMQANGCWMVVGIQDASGL